MDTLSFWIPIVPDPNCELTTQEWIRSEADRLLYFGRQVYRVDSDFVCKMEEVPSPSFWEVILKIVLIATLVLPLVALAIKYYDRQKNHYTLLIPSPENALPLPPQLKEEDLSPSSPPLLSPAPLPLEEDLSSSFPSLLSSEPLPLEEDLPLPSPSIQHVDPLQYAREEAVREEKKGMERLRNIHNVAMSCFPKMVAMYYRPDGQLNNEFEKNARFNKFWGLSEMEYPENLRTKADEMEQEGKTVEAEKYRKKAEENEKKRLDRLQNDFQQTLFPICFHDGTKLTSDECFASCTEIFTDQELFHGTTKARAELITQEGFNPEWPAGNRYLDTGYGVYLALDEMSAQNYARKDSDGKGTVLKVKVQTKGKFAQYDPRIFHLVNDCFIGMANFFVEKHSKEILEELEKAGLREAGDSTFMSLNEIVYPLVNLFTRDVYTRQGFRGVYARGSIRAQCNYLNLFYPKEDIVSIT